MRRGSLALHCLAGVVAEAARRTLQDAQAAVLSGVDASAQHSRIPAQIARTGSSALPISCAPSRCVNTAGDARVRIALSSFPDFRIATPVDPLHAVVRSGEVKRVVLSQASFGSVPGQRKRLRPARR